MYSCLVRRCQPRIIAGVQERRTHWLPILLVMVAAAVTRTPELMPPNFSAMIALAFCAGAFFPGRLGWGLPLLTLLVTDVLLNRFVYGVSLFSPGTLAFLAGNYAVYLLVIALGRKVSHRASFLGLLGGGLLGAIAFYFLTNTISWLLNPAYVKTLAGWLQSLTTGVPGYPPTWTFFLNTLASTGLFTGLFSAVMKFSAAAEAAREKEAEESEREEEAEPVAEPEPEEGRG
jgi:hypothetical protein